SGQPCRISSFCARDNNGVADLYVGNGDRWQTFKHVLHIRTAATTTLSSAWSAPLAASLPWARSGCRRLSAAATWSRHHHHPAHLICRGKLPQNCILLHNNRQRLLRLQVVDLNLTGSMVDRRDYAGHSFERTGNYFFRSESSALGIALTQRPKLIAHLKFIKFRYAGIGKLDRVWRIATKFNFVCNGND